MLLSLDNIDSIQSVKTETLSFPTLGVTVEVGEIDRECFIECAKLSETLGDTIEGNEAVELRMAGNAIISSGKRAFNTPEGMQKIAEKFSKIAIQQIAGVAMKLSGIGVVEKKS